MTIYDAFAKYDFHEFSTVPWQFFDDDPRPRQVFVAASRLPRMATNIPSSSEYLYLQRARSHAIALRNQKLIAEAEARPRIRSTPAVFAETSIKLPQPGSTFTMPFFPLSPSAWQKTVVDKDCGHLRLAPGR